MKPKPHISQAKTSEVNQAVKLMSEHPIIGIVNMQNLPAAQLANMKMQLRNSVTLFMTKKRLLKIAVEQLKGKKKGIEKLESCIKGMPALLVTKENPFSLYKIIKKNKSQAPAKAGQVAPKDIVIKAGPTPFAPGPVIGELGAIGLKTGIDAGKVVIKEDSVVCKEGKPISDKLASILLRLGITPMEIGLDISGVYENGVIYEKSVLDVDEDKFLADLVSAGQNAFNLAIELGIPTKESTIALIQKASMQVRALAESQNIITSETLPGMLAKAKAQAETLESVKG